MDQTAEDDRLSAVGGDDALGGGPQNVIDEDRLATDSRRHEGSAVIVTTRTGRVDVHDDQSIGSNARTYVHDQTNFDVFGHDLRSGHTVVDHISDASDQTPDLHEAFGIVHRHDLRPAQNLQTVRIL